MYLGASFVNSPKLSDVTFVVEGRSFHAHRIALLNASEIFRTMFDGHYREKDASTIPIPNIRWEVFECMMHCIYTGAPAAWLAGLAAGDVCACCTVSLMVDACRSGALLPSALHLAPFTHPTSAVAAAAASALLQAAWMCPPRWPRSC